MSVTRYILEYMCIMNLKRISPVTETRIPRTVALWQAKKKRKNGKSPLVNVMQKQMHHHKEVKNAQKHNAFGLRRRNSVMQDMNKKRKQPKPPNGVL